MLCCLLSPICPKHIRKDKSFKLLPVGKLAEILALHEAQSFSLSWVVFLVLCVLPPHPGSLASLLLAAHLDLLKPLEAPVFSFHSSCFFRFFSIPDILLTTLVFPFFFCFVFNGVLEFSTFIHDFSYILTHSFSNFFLVSL